MKTSTQRARRIVHVLGMSRRIEELRLAEAHRTLEVNQAEEVALVDALCEGGLGDPRLSKALRRRLERASKQIHVTKLEIVDRRRDCASANRKHRKAVERLDSAERDYDQQLEARELRDIVECAIGRSSVRQGGPLKMDRSDDLEESGS